MIHGTDAVNGILIKPPGKEFLAGFPAGAPKRLPENSIGATTLSNVYWAVG